MVEMNKTIVRKAQEVSSSVKSKKREEDWANNVEAVEVTEEVVEDENENDDIFIVFDKVPIPKQSNTMSLRNLAKECDRWAVSNRAGAAIANAALIDAGFISPDDQKYVIDKSKLRRAINNYRKERQEEDIKNLGDKQGIAYYFDGKKHCPCV